MLCPLEFKCKKSTLSQRSGQLTRKVNSTQIPWVLAYLDSIVAFNDHLNAILEPVSCIIDNDVVDVIKLILLIYYNFSIVKKVAKRLLMWSQQGL